MDGDEILALIVSAGVALAATVRWYGGLTTITALGGGRTRRAWLATVPVASLISVQVVLGRWAAHEVREQPEYDLLFLLGGAAWLGLAGWSLPMVGLIARDDAIENRNPAGAIALCGTWIGVMLCYAGGNVGEGPTIWTTFGPAALASVALLLAWLVLEFLTHISEAIAVERDPASGVRLAGFLIASGFVLGRAVAGDWVSTDDTIHDFIVLGWPVVLFLLSAVILQFIWRPTPERPRQPVVAHGVVPSVALVLIAASYVLLLGPPTHQQHRG